MDKKEFIIQEIFKYEGSTYKPIRERVEKIITDYRVEEINNLGLSLLLTHEIYMRGPSIVSSDVDAIIEVANELPDMFLEELASAGLYAYASVPHPFGHGLMSRMRSMIAMAKKLSKGSHD